MPEPAHNPLLFDMRHKMFSRFITWFFWAGFLFGSALPLFGELAIRIGQNFTGSTYGLNTTSRPADPNGAVGPTQFVELINGRFAVYSKTNGTLLKGVSDTNFWQSTGIIIPAGNRVADPRLLFDPVSQRWFAAGVLYNPASLVASKFVVAVSQSTDATTTWRGVSFNADPTTGNVADFPTLGLDRTGVYLSANLFNGSTDVGSTLVSIPKVDLLLSTPTVANATVFGLLNYAARGEILQPVFSPDSAAPARVLGIGDLGYDSAWHSNLVISTISNAAVPGKAVLSGGISVPVVPYFKPLPPPQPNPAANDLDAGDTRISATARQVGNVIYWVHTTGINIQGAANNYSGQSALRWYKLNATTSAILESGTISDPELHFFFPSIAANDAGVVVIGCNGSSSNSYVSSYAFTGEMRNGTTVFTGPILLQPGTASYKDTQSSYGATRWGDYSATSLDPTDPTRFWTIQMIPIGSKSYATRITEIQAVVRPELAISATPAGITVAWPASAAGFVLETSASPGPGAVWQPFTAAIATNSAQITVRVSSDNPSFFRLSLR